MQYHCLHTEPKKSNHEQPCKSNNLLSGIYNEQMLDYKKRQQHFFLKKTTKEKNCSDQARNYVICVK